MKTYMLYITASDPSEARHIADTLLEERLIACANLMPGIISVYRWQGKTEETGECLLFAKTSKDTLEKTIERVKNLHSYDCPCIVALPIEGGYPPFLKWIQEETATS